MHKNNDFNDQTLGAFVDGQLDTEISESIIKAMDSDINIRNKVYDLRRSKDLMKLGFKNLSLSSRKTIKKRSLWNRFTMSIAASISAIALSVSSGFFGYYFSTLNEATVDNYKLTSLQNKSHKILLHISESNIKHFTAALDFVETFLLEHKEEGAEIAVIANAGGLDFMRPEVSPFEKKIINLMKEHSNIHFIACANSVRSLRQKNINFNLIEQVSLNKPAMDHIIEYIQNGWTYKKVNTLLKI